MVLSAHGSAPTVHAEAGRRHLDLIDATCPLVTKVHLEARRFSDDDRTIVLIGHEGHEEVEGTSGQAPDRTILVQSVAEAERVEVSDPITALLPHPDHALGGRDERDRRRAPERFPEIQGPPREDICYATQNRQDAIKEVAGRADVVLVIGSKNSSNSNRLAEVSRERGNPGLPGGRRDRGGPRLARGGRRRRPHVGGLGARVARGRDDRLARGAGFDRVEQALITEEHVRFALPAAVRATTTS